MLFSNINQHCSLYISFFQAQGELINQVETHTENAVANVHAGTQHLAQASRFKAASYPLLGALLGTCVGGPIGLLAGMKLGAAAALSGSFLGMF